MRLFSVAKVPCYCEAITHRIERRKSGDAKVVDLSLKIDPFTAQLASALDQAEHGGVKRKLFKQNNGEPDRDLRAAEFRPPGDRQKLICFASPDTSQASIALDHVKITKMRARGQKDGDRWVFVLVASAGPLGKTELEYVSAFHAEMRFITFEEAEPSLEFEQLEDTEDDADLTDADEKARRPAPMFDTDAAGRVTEVEGTPLAAETARVRRQRSRGSRPKPSRGKRRR